MTNKELADDVRYLSPSVPEEADEYYGRAMYRDGFEAAVAEVLAMLAARPAGEVTYEVRSSVNNAFRTGGHATRDDAEKERLGASDPLPWHVVEVTRRAVGGGTAGE